MPRKKNSEPAASARPARFTSAALDALLAEAGPLAGPGDVEPLLRALKQAVVERALGAELTHHLGYGPGDAKPVDQPNHRNGSTPKTVLTDDGAGRPGAQPNGVAAPNRPRVFHHQRRVSQQGAPDRRRNA